jgi:hypothetical protein
MWLQLRRASGTQWVVPDNPRLIGVTQHVKGHNQATYAARLVNYNLWAGGADRGKASKGHVVKEPVHW